MLTQFLVPSLHFLYLGFAELTMQCLHNSLCHHCIIYILASPSLQSNAYTIPCAIIAFFISWLRRACDAMLTQFLVPSLHLQPS